MKKLEIPNGFYIDALPTGEFACCLFDGSVATHLGTLRASNSYLPFYIRITNIAGFRFAGQSSGSKQTLTWDESFKFLDITPVGTNPVIYDKLGNLVISDGSVGSQGYRYVDYYTGRLVTGDETLYSPIYKLAEFTDLGDGLIIGQGTEVIGCQLWDGSFHRMIDPDDCYIIRANRVGNDVAISYYKHNKPSVINWLTIDELRKLSIVNPPVVEIRNIFIYQTLVGKK